MSCHSVAAFYRFLQVDSERIDPLTNVIVIQGKASGLKGLIIFGPEGINGTVSGAAREAVESFLDWAAKLLETVPFEAKWSTAEDPPFRKFKVRSRQEIVTLGRPDVVPLAPHSDRHLLPKEWEKALQEKDVVVLDTRNWYETRIGSFQGAIDPAIDEFQDFSAYLDRTEIGKERKILIYCTGGIRCEKAIVEMDQKGFKNVYQLDGGILNYLAELPHRSFQGECFVFDDRVAVDQELRPSRVYQLCPHCGQPAELQILCARCDQTAVVCDRCAKGELAPTCSKNCAHHFARTPGKKGRSQKG